MWPLAVCVAGVSCVAWQYIGVMAAWRHGNMPSKRNVARRKWRVSIAVWHVAINVQMKILQHVMAAKKCNSS